MGPVGRAEGADSARSEGIIQGIDNLGDRSFRIIPVQQVDINIVRLQCFQAFFQLGLDDLPVDADRSVRRAVAALGQDDHFFPVMAFLNPVPQAGFRRAVTSGRIKCIDAICHGKVHQDFRADAHEEGTGCSAEEQAGYGFVESRKRGLRTHRPTLGKQLHHASESFDSFNMAGAGCVRRCCIFHGIGSIKPIFPAFLDQLFHWNDAAARRHGNDDLSVQALLPLREIPDADVLQVEPDDTILAFSVDFHFICCGIRHTEIASVKDEPQIRNPVQHILHILRRCQRFVILRGILKTNTDAAGCGQLAGRLEPLHCQVQHLFTGQLRAGLLIVGPWDHHQELCPAFLRQFQVGLNILRYTLRIGIKRRIGDQTAQMYTVFLEGFQELLLPVNHEFKLHQIRFFKPGFRNDPGQKIRIYYALHGILQQRKGQYCLFHASGSFLCL